MIIDLAGNRLSVACFAARNPLYEGLLTAALPRLVKPGP